MKRKILMIATLFLGVASQTLYTQAPDIYIYPAMWLSYFFAIILSATAKGDGKEISSIWWAGFALLCPVIEMVQLAELYPSSHSSLPMVANMAKKDGIGIFTFLGGPGLSFFAFVVPIITIIGNSTLVKKIEKEIGPVE